MARRVFISFKAEDKARVDGLRLLAKNPNYELDFYDESVRAPVNSTNADYIKQRIRDKIRRCGVVLCLVNSETHTSSWVDWELRTAINLEKPVVAMAVKGLHRATLPAPIRGGVRFRNWDPGALGELLDHAVVIRPSS